MSVLAEPKGGARIELELSGMTCASCAARIERKLNKLDGVHATVNFATERASVAFDPALADVEQLVGTVERTGYGAALAGRAEGRDELAGLSRRLLVSAVLTAPVAVLAMVSATQFAGWRWFALALSTPVVFWGGWLFHRAALQNVRHLAATMDTLISVGTLAAWLWSAVVLL